MTTANEFELEIAKEQGMAPCQMLCPVAKRAPIAHDYWYGTFNLCAECRELHDSSERSNDGTR